TERAERPDRVEMARHQYRLTDAGGARDQVVAETLAPGNAGELGTGARQLRLRDIHQAIDRGGIRGGRLELHPLGKFGEQVLGAAHIGLWHRFVLDGCTRSWLCAPDRSPCP